MYVCMYAQPQEPMRAEGPKECLTTHSSYGTVFGRVVEQDHMWQATKFQTLIVVCNARYSDTSHS